jgi:SAM-dependent methyltransferase
MENIGNSNAELRRSRSRWKKLSRKMIIKQKRSTKNLIRLCEENASKNSTLIVHTEDVDYRPYFPNSYIVSKRKDKPADLYVDKYFREISKIKAESYEVILCTGLLEHVPNPQRLIDDLQKILVPGGKLIMSASAVFSYHEGPDNFFHFTTFGFKHLFRNWSKIESVKGSSQPFETIGILIQRILLQCVIFPFV